MAQSSNNYLFCELAIWAVISWSPLCLWSTIGQQGVLLLRLAVTVNWDNGKRVKVLGYTSLNLQQSTQACFHNSWAGF